MSVVNPMVTEVQLKIVADMLVGIVAILTTVPLDVTVFPALSVPVTVKLFAPPVSHVRVIVRPVVHVAKFPLTTIPDNALPASLHVPVIVILLHVNCVQLVVLIVINGAILSMMTLEESVVVIT